jgi:hypothetical protein
MVTTSSDAMQWSHSSALEVFLHLLNVHYQDLSMPVVASLFTTIKPVAAAATAALAGRLQNLYMPITSSTNAEDFKAWLVKHAAMVEKLHTLKLDLQLSDDILSTTAAAGILRLLSSEANHITAADAAPVQAAAAILQQMPATLKTLEFKLPSSFSSGGSVGRQLSSQAAALRQILQRPPTTTPPSPSAAAAAHLTCLPPPGYLSSRLTNLTSLTMTGVNYATGLQLLRDLPTFLQDLDISLVADDSTCRRMMQHPGFFHQLQQQQQQSMQMGHLKGLRFFKITSSQDLSLALGPNSQPPPKLERLEARIMHVKSLAAILQLSRLQYLEVGSFDNLDAAGAAAIDSMLQLEYVAGISCSIKENPEEADEELLAAFALPSFKKTSVYVHPAGADGAQPSSIVARLSSLTNLASLTIEGGFHDEGQLAASLAQLTSLSELSLWSPACNPVRLVGAQGTGDVLEVQHPNCAVITVTIWAVTVRILRC